MFINSAHILSIGAALGLKDLYNDHRELVSYLIFGVLTTVVNWLAYMIFVWCGLEINLSNILSWIVGVTFAFVTNKWYVFRNRSTEAATVGREFLSFVGARIVTGIIAIVLFPILYNIGLNQSLFGTDGFLAKIVTSAIEIILNWAFSKYLVFRENR